MRGHLRWIGVVMMLASCAPGDPAGILSGGREHGMMNCPSAVDGATTQLALTPDGVDLTITAIHPEPRREIVRRARIQAAQGNPRLDHPRHSGEHGGPGTAGYCAVIHDDTRVSFVEVLGGVRLHVQALRAADVASLQQATQQRVAVQHGR